MFKSSSSLKVPNRISHILLSIKSVEKNEKLNCSSLPIVRKCWSKEGSVWFWLQCVMHLYFISLKMKTNVLMIGIEERGTVAPDGDFTFW